MQTLLAAPGAEGRNCIARLQTLEGLQLAKQEGPGVWRLLDGWRENLVAIGEREEMLQRLVPLVGRDAIRQKALTPRFMRRTFQDLGSAANVHDFVVRAISGHATTSMQEHYSSVSASEVREGLAKVIALAGITSKSGYAGGYAAPPRTDGNPLEKQKAL